MEDLEYTQDFYEDSLPDVSPLDASENYSDDEANNAFGRRRKRK